MAFFTIPFIFPIPVFSFQSNLTLLGGRGRDILFGRFGDDTIAGGRGKDLLFGGFGNDFIAGDAGKDLLFGGFGDDTLFGGEGSDRLNGGFGNDVLVGNQGDDIVRGGFGNDLLVWNNGDGSDLLDGGVGFDTVQVNFNTNLVEDNLANDDVVRIADSDFFGLNLARVELNGQTEVGLFELDIRRAERLEVNGGGGNDTLEVLANLLGEVTFDFDGGGDEADARAASAAAALAQGDTIDLSGLDLSATEVGVRIDLDENNQGVLQAENDLSNSTRAGLSEFGNVQIGGEVVIPKLNDFENAIGTAFDDTIFGNAQNNVLIGGAGDDALHPFGGEDFVDGGDGTDVLLLNGFPKGSLVDVAAGTAAFLDGTGGTNTFINIENVNGSTVAGDEIFGDAGGNVLNGLGGNDLLVGRDGDDVLIGGDNIDRARAAAQGDNADTLFGGLGADTLTGGLGADTFGFAAIGEGQDTITDFAIAEDRFGLRADNFDIAGDLSFVNALAADLPAAGSNVIVLQNADDDGDAATIFNARSAAGLIGDAVTESGAGFFVYFNSGLGVNRLVHSSDLSNGDATLNVLARLDNLEGQAAIDALPTFTADNVAFLA